MWPMIAAMAAGALIKNKQQEAEAEAEQRAMTANASAIRYSPWTGMNASMMAPKGRSKLAGLAEGATSGAMFGQQFGGMMDGSSAAGASKVSPTYAPQNAEDDLLQRGQWQGAQAEAPSFYRRRPPQMIG